MSVCLHCLTRNPLKAGKGWLLFLLWCPWHPAQGLVCSRHSINTYRMSEWMSKSVAYIVNAMRKRPMNIGMQIVSYL